ncbi:hypothetical protein COU37_04645 [Candidatus Micrarchaeota archaeon CG10_big_fil_rev_8_21_14_0_10_45_29]|nr:MAG: hypothetical protein COU37_04645 [Candidatus Micrarchaeota archaeon CG10_big_fil_rev_8_21_14_0_10_45_29]
MSETTKDKSSESFLKEVSAVCAAEEKAHKKVEDASAKASKIVSDAHSEAVKITTNASKGAVSEKNSIISKGRAEADNSIKKIIEAANKKAASLSSTRLSERDAKKLAESLLED